MAVSDATEPLLTLDPHSVYVVGGIVDPHIQPGLTSNAQRWKARVLDDYRSQSLHRTAAITSSR